MMNDQLTSLSGDELQFLSDFLQSDATGDDCLPLEAVDGLFCALVTGPQLVAAEDWLPVVWGEGEEPKFADEAERERVTSLLRRHFATVAVQLEQAVTQSATPYQPLVDEWEISKDEDVPLNGEWWAAGFLVGLEYCEQAWFGEPEREEMLEPLLMPVIELAGNEDLEPVSAKARQRRIDQLPALLLTLYRYWRTDADGQLQLAAELGAVLSNQPLRAAEAPGRNDPCSCGSGKKYKKCCGANG